MKYNIYRNNELVASVSPTGTYEAKIMGEEKVTMHFSLHYPFDFFIGDMVEVYGQLFIMNVAPTEEKISSIHYNYTLDFESIKYELGKVQLLFPDENNILSIADFSIMGDARRILELIVQNANRIQTGWKLGKVDQTETKNISFSAHNLLTALTMLAQEFKNEFWIDKDKTIHFTTRKDFSGLTLQYGQKKGLRSLSRNVVDSSNIVTRLYAYGSTKNIKAENGNWNSRLRMDVPFLEMNVDKYGVVEHTEIFEDVFPNRIGKVTAVNAANFLQFADERLEFDLNSNEILIAGTSAKVTFNSGQLAGYTFEVKEKGFDFKTKTFELIQNQEEKAIKVPSELMRPAVGDEYVLTDIVMPEQYKKEAQAELKNRAQEYINANSAPRMQYTAVADLFYFEDQNIELVLGQTVKMIDQAFKLDSDIRLVALSQDIQNKYNVSFVLADEIQVSKYVHQYLEDQKWSNKIIQHQQKIDRNIRRNYQFSREIQDNIFDTDGYFDAEKIKPLSIETKMLAVGARSQQYTVKDVQLNIIDNQTIQNTVGQLVHFTINDTGEKVWNVLAGQVQNISNGFNYIYLKCQREGNNANFVVTTEQYKFDAFPDYYYFEYGYLSSVIDGFRKIKTSFGFSNINGGEITSGRILGQNGDLFLDIDNRKVYGSVEFLPESPAFNQIKESINIGGRNLLKNSNFSKGFDWELNGCKVVEHRGYYMIKTENIHQGIYKIFDFIKKQEEYTISITTMGDFSTATKFQIGMNNGEKKEVEISPDSKQWNTVSVTVKSRIDQDAIIIYSTENGRNDFLIKHIKIEKGNKATDWTAAPEDLETEISKINTTLNHVDKVTSFLGTNISGNVVATGALLVGDKNTNNGGLSGVLDQGNDSIFLYAGHEFNKRYSAPFRVTHGGSAVMTNAYVSGHVVASSGSFTGSIYAENGNIGGLKLENKLLKTDSLKSGLWFTLENDYIKSSITIGNNTGNGVSWGDKTVYPLLQIENTQKSNIVPFDFYKSGIFLNMKAASEYSYSTAIHIEEGTLTGIAHEIESYITGQSIRKNTDVCYATSDDDNYTTIYLPDNPRIGKRLTILNPQTHIKACKAVSRKHSIGFKWLASKKEITFNNTLELIFIGGSWIVINNI